MLNVEKLKDKTNIQQWLQSGASYNDVANASAVGIVGNCRFSERAKRIYLKLWEWSDIRLSSSAQDRLWARDKKAYERRIRRCQRIIESLKA